MAGEIGSVTGTGVDLAKVQQRDETDHFKRLPDEIVLEIFKYVPTKSLATCALVCKRWRHIAYDKELWTDVGLNLNWRNSTINFFGLSHVLLRGANSLTATRLTIEGPLSWGGALPENCQLNLKSLKLYKCVFSPKALALLLTHSDHLERLTLEKCRSLNPECINAIGNKRELKSLSLRQSSTCPFRIGVLQMESLLQGLPRLLSLDLSRCCLYTDVLDCLAVRLPSSLVRLRLADVNGALEDSHILQIIGACSNLVEFDVYGYNAFVSTVGYNAVNALKATPEQDAVLADSYASSEEDSDAWDSSDEDNYCCVGFNIFG